MSRDFSSVGQIVTNDFQAMYAYKCGSDDKCLSLCENNVVYLLRGSVAGVILVQMSDLLHLMDDESLSLIGLAKLCGLLDINLRQGNSPGIEFVSQLTLLVYLLVQCKLRLKHPRATFIETLRIAMATCFRHHNDDIINRSLMMFAYRKAIKHLH